MRWLCSAVLALMATMPARAERVVSLNLCTDQFLVLLAPEKIAALSSLARDPALSFVASQAMSFPIVRADAEAVLQLHPDLVLAGKYGAQTTLALLHARGLRVVQADEPQNFAQIVTLTRSLAQLLGQVGRGEALISEMQARLAALPRPKMPRTAILWQARGWTVGPHSLGDAILKQAGFTNLGTGGVMGVESILHAKPDFLVTETQADFPSMATDMLEHPALREQPRKRVPPALMICGGPFSANAATMLAQ